MITTLKLNCKVCKEPMEMPLAEGWDEVPQEWLDFFGTMVCCDRCITRMGYGGKRRRAAPQPEPREAWFPYREEA